MGRAVGHGGKSAEGRYIIKILAAEISHIQHLGFALHDHIQAPFQGLGKAQGVGVIVGAAHRQISQFRRVVPGQKAVGGVMKSAVPTAADHHIDPLHAPAPKDFPGAQALLGGIDDHLIPASGKSLDDHIQIPGNMGPSRFGVIQQQHSFHSMGHSSSSPLRGNKRLYLRRP